MAPRTYGVTLLKLPLFYCGVLPDDFDYKKELAEYRDERYGNID